MRSPHCRRLIDFDVHVNIANESKRGKERYCSEHQTEGIARQDRETKELSSLKSSRHVGPLIVVEHTIEENEYRSGPVIKCMQIYST